MKDWKILTLFILLGLILVSYTIFTSCSKEIVSIDSCDQLEAGLFGKWEANYETVAVGAIQVRVSRISFDENEINYQSEIVGLESTRFWWKGIWWRIDCDAEKDIVIVHCVLKESNKEGYNGKDCFRCAGFLVLHK